MIEFNCQHCGKLLRLNDSYAGRDGWCRVCKRMVIVPDGTGPARIEDLPPEVGYARMQRLLQYAATKADQFRQEQARQAGMPRSPAEPDSIAVRAAGALAEAEARHTQLQHEIAAAESTLEAARQRAAALEAASIERERRLVEETAEADAALEDTLQSERALRESLEVRLQEAEAALATALRVREDVVQGLEARLRDGEAALSEARKEADEARESSVSRGQQAAEDVDAAVRANDELRQALADSQQEAAYARRVLDETSRRQHELEQQLSALQQHVAEVEGERDRLARDLENVTAGDQDSAGLVVEKEKAIGLLHGEIARLNAAQTALEDEAEARVRALEAEVGRLAGAADRAAKSEILIHELEQAQLQQTLALEEARREAERAGRRAEALEEAVRQAAAVDADHAVTVDHFKREIAGRDEQIRRLSGELDALAAEQTATVLERDKGARALHTAEGRADLLAADLESLRDQHGALIEARTATTRERDALHARVVALEQELACAQSAAAEAGLIRAQLTDLQAQLAVQSEAACKHASDLEAAAEAREALAAEVQSLREAVAQADARSASDREQAAATASAYESEIASLKGALESARLTAGADADAIATALSCAEAEAASVRDELRRAQLEWESERRSLNDNVTELQAELMNLNLSLESAEASVAAAIAARDTALAEAAAREQALADEVAALRSENDGLTEALSAADETFFEDSDNSGESDVIVLEARTADGTPAPNSGAGDSAVEKLRLQERKEMMDVLSEFLNK